MKKIKILTALGIGMLIFPNFCPAAVSCPAAAERKEIKAEESEEAPAVNTAGDFVLRRLDNETVELTDHNVPVWDYVFDTKTCPDAPEEDLRRTAASFFHPLFSIDGEVLTLSFSVSDNHTHHHGLWSSFTTVIRHREDGTEELYDTWTDDTALKKQFIRWGDEPFAAEGDSAVMTVENGWFISGKENIMNESLRTVTGPMQEDAALGRYRTIDFYWTWRPVRDEITLAGDREFSKNFSSLAIRFLPPEVKPVILSENGEIEEDEMTGSIPWIDYYEARTPDGGKKGYGTAIFPSIRNTPPDVPNKAGMAIRHYGLIAAGWPGLEGIRLTPERGAFAGYRVIIHETPWTAEQLLEQKSLFDQQEQAQK